MGSPARGRGFVRSPALWLALLPWPVVGLALRAPHGGGVAFAAYALVCGVGFAILRRQDPSPIAWRPRLSWRVHVAVGLFGAGLFPLLFRAWGAQLLPPSALHAGLADLGISPASYVWLFPWYAIVNPLLEEMFWRGGMYRSLRDRLGAPGTATAVSSVLFASWHALVVFRLMPALPAALAVAGIAAVGLLLAVVYERTGSLGDVVLLHALAFDAPLLVVLALAGG